MFRVHEQAATCAPGRASVGRPIFISGCNRGGTTILARLLARHPDLHSIGRGSFHEGQHIWRRRFRDRSRHRWAVGIWRWALRRTGDHATRELLDFFRDAFGEAMDGPGRMLEKTPANAIRIPFIDRLYPDCYFVHLLRDGRHTTASLMARRVMLPYAPRQWVGAHRTALGDLAQLPSERVAIVRYEELLADPEETLGGICRTCDLRWDESAQSALASGARELLAEPDVRWARLAPWKRRYILSVIQDLQAKLGYPVEL